MKKPFQARVAILGFAVLCAGQVTAQSGPPIMPGPGIGVQCQNGPGPTFDDPDGTYMFKWCPATTMAGYAQSDSYSIVGGSLVFKSNQLYNCVSEEGFIKTRLTDAQYAAICP